MVPKICSIDGCGRAHYGRGWCGLHYRRWWKHGDPMGGGVRHENTDHAIAAKTIRSGNCIIWTGGTDRHGYGMVSIDNRMRYTHRYVWERANGRIPDGIHIDHICRQPLCCNVGHLRLATRKQNNEHQGIRATNTSGYRGVSWHKRMRKWESRVTHNQVTHRLGFYSTAEEAGEVARLKRLELYTHNNLDRVA